MRRRSSRWGSAGAVYVTTTRRAGRLGPIGQRASRFGRTIEVGGRIDRDARESPLPTLCWSLQLEALDIGRIHVLTNREDLPILDVYDPTVAVVIHLAVLETTGTVRLGDDLIPLAEERLDRVLRILAFEKT